MAESDLSWSQQSEKKKFVLNAKPILPEITDNHSKSSKSFRIETEPSLNELSEQSTILFSSDRKFKREKPLNRRSNDGQITINNHGVINIKNATKTD